MTATAPPNASLFAFDNSYVRDLGGYYVACGPAQAPSPTLLRFNEVLARELGLDPVEVPVTSDRDADIVQGTANLAAAFEASIRKHPEQWMWAHRRWG